MSKLSLTMNVDYSNEDGKEKLVVNGKDVLNPKTGLVSISPKGEITVMDSSGKIVVRGSVSAWAGGVANIAASGNSAVFETEGSMSSWAGGRVAAWASGRVTAWAEGSVSSWAGKSKPVTSDGRVTVWAGGTAPIILDEDSE